MPMLNRVAELTKRRRRKNLEKIMVDLQRMWEEDEEYYTLFRYKNLRGIGSSQIAVVIDYLLKTGIIT